MSSRKLAIEPTAEELTLAESLLQTMVIGDDDERSRSIAAWKQANMPAVRKLLAQHFNVMFDQMAERFETRSRRESVAQTLDRQFPRLSIETSVTFQGTDGNRMVRELPEPKRTRSASDDDWDDYDDDDGGRFPNDDRSDSMNPNNDSYQASADNRSDQMNPNNDAYGSSRR